jgi:TolB protein
LKRRYCFLLLNVVFLIAGCGGSDPFSGLTPDPTPAPDPGPPPPVPSDFLATSPPAGMIGRIAYIGEVANDFFAIHIFVTSPDGASATSLFPLEDLFSYTGPSWGPAGDRLVMASNLQGSAEWDIYTVNVDGSGIEHTISGPSNGDFAPSWSPDGSQIVFQSAPNPVSGFDIYHYDVETEVITNLTNSDGDDELPSWAPDGTRVLFQTTTSGGNAASSGTNLALINADATGLVALTTGVGFQNSAGAFSPDGQLIAFESTQHQEVSATATIGDFEIYTMKSDGSDQRRVSVGAGTTDAARFPTWSPDGRHIAFEFHDFTLNQLFSVTFIGVMNADGSNMYLLQDQPVFGRFPRWGP